VTRRSGAPHPAEVEGFLQGVAHRLTETPDPEAARLVDDARAAIRAGAWARAADRLEAASARLDALVPEDRLREWPRGLVEYVSTRPLGGPPGREEDPVANRLLLVQRLLAVRRADGIPVDDLVPPLADAEAAVRRGDATTARRLVDEVHRQLDGRTRLGTTHRSGPRTGAGTG
jgi:hypothetical protein